MPEVVPRELLKPLKIKDNGALLPHFQKNITGGMDSYYTIPMNPAAPSNAIGGGKQLYFDLERDECGEINDLCLEFEVSCSTAEVELAPTPYWFERIVIEASKGSGDILKTIWPEEFFIWNQITQSDEARQRWAKLSNYKLVSLKQDGLSEKLAVGENNKFKVGETKKIYLQLPALFLHLDALDMKQIRSDLRIRMEMANSTSCVISGDASNLSLDNVKLFVRSFNEESYDNARRQTRQNKNKHKYVYTDCERLQINDKTLTASTTTRIPLDSFVGKAGMIAVYIKPSTNPVASDKSIYDYQNVGPSATFDVTNSAGQSLLGNGTAINEEQLNNIFSSETGNPHLDGLYVIPFCEDIKKTLLGVVNGVFDFVSVHDYLEITFDSAPTSEVHTITQNAVSSAGTYRYAFEKCGISDQELDYNSNASAIKTVLDATPELKERNITVTAGGDLTSATQTITFNAGSGKVSEELGKITILGNGTSKVNNTAVTTQGKKGWTTGSGYQITVLMYKFKCLHVDTKGNITCKEM